ncbi:hypothetical protein O3M35_003225 [Rhynocoris fuscipes]|uniref:TROVE domain-containing protein n=1 Tax=Rhynocoris fuscipes TaxID=488301 RepID=A0AAW1CLQ6_9HEMI
MAQTDPERKLLRILHYGSEEACYIPGCRLQAKFYSEERVNQLRTLIAEIEQTVLFETIRKVIRNKTSLFPELILYVLAECARSENLRPEALNVAEELCTTPKLFLLFFKFAKGLSPHIGTGRACRRFISNWYLNKDSLELAEMVGQTPCYRGWRHSDLIKIAHVKTVDPGKGAVLTYCAKGLKAMLTKFGDNTKAKEVVSYLQHVDNFRRDGDQTSVIRTIESYMLTIHHLNFSHLKNKQVWIALLRRMPVDTLMDYLHLLCKYRMFRKGRQWDQEFLTAVCDVLSNFNSVVQSRIQPSRVYINLCEYQSAPKFKLELAAKSHKRLAQKPPAVSFELVQNLQSLINLSYRNVAPTGLRFVISVDNTDMAKRRCSHILYMMANQAAAAIATTFFVSEDQCDVVLCHSPPTRVELNSKDIKMQDVADKLIATDKSNAKGSRNIFGGLKWAVDNKKEVDVFIIIGCSLKFQGIANKLAEYRSKLIVPNFKLILCTICGLSKQPIIDDMNVFTIVGFDANVCNVISRFATGAF